MSLPLCNYHGSHDDIIRMVPVACGRRGLRIGGNHEISAQKTDKESL